VPFVITAGLDGAFAPLSRRDLLRVVRHEVGEVLFKKVPVNLDTIALWCAHSYLLRNEVFGVRGQRS
jgi:hypothetical protein